MNLTGNLYDILRKVSDTKGVIVLIKEEKYNKKDKQGGMFVEREQYVDSSYHEYRGQTL